MRKLTKIAIFTLLVVFTVIATSCKTCKRCNQTVGGGGDDLNLSEVDINKQIEIEYWHANGSQLTTVLEKIRDDFQTKYPNYTVKLVSYGDYETLRKTITASIAGGIAPTAAQTYPDHVALYNTGYALQPLNPYIEDETYGMSAEEQAQFIDGFWAEGAVYDNEGTRYAMPFNKSTELMFYNKTLFDEQGWDVPKTWDDVIAICEAWKKTDHYKKAAEAYPGQVFGMGYDSEANLFITLSQQYGAVYTSFDENGNGRYNVFGAVESDMLKSKQAMNWYLEQYKKGNIGTSTALSTDYCSDAFKNGQCIMTIGSSAGATYNDGSQSSGEKFETGVTAVPQKDLNNGQVIQQGTNVSLFDCEDPAEELVGWLWLKHMVSYESALTWALETSYFPIRKDVLNSQEYQDHINGIERLEDGTAVPGVVTLAAKAKAAGLLQQNWYYTNIAFPGSSKARENAETLVQILLYGNSTMDQAYLDAYNELRD